jgi:non-specific serine/threonine protein kinase
LADPALVVQAVAAAARAREEPNRPLAETLRSRRVLLVLDNCEHVLDACTALRRWLLAECPRLRMLATSRQPLGIVGEAVWSVPSLALPDPERLPPLARLMEYDGVRLFSA